jgi:hypothetical protein
MWGNFSSLKTAGLLVRAPLIEVVSPLNNYYENSLSTFADRWISFASLQNHYTLMTKLSDV